MTDMYINKNTGWNARWKDYEDEIIKKYYPSHGANETSKYLENRSLQSITARASKLGIKYLTYDETFFNVIDTPVKAYWLGFLYADGYVTTDYRWGLELSYIDISHMEAFTQAFNYNGKIKIRERDNKKYCCFQIKNKRMYDSLVGKGVIRNKTTLLQFPDEDVLAPEYYSHFIRGFFDGDGCVSFGYTTRARKDRGNRVYTRLYKEISIVCKSDEFIYSILNVLSENNIHLNLTKNSHHNNLNYLRTSSMIEIQKFYNYIYADSCSFDRLNRKFDKFNDLFIATTNSDVS